MDPNPKFDFEVGKENEYYKWAKQHTGRKKLN